MKLSVIIPIYNAVPYLRECLRSVIAASDKLKVVNDKLLTEIICVDDGSTDGSSAILDEYAAKEVEKLGVAAERSEGRATRGDSRAQRVPRGGERRIKVIHQSNQGVSVARNRGLEEATGEWVAFVDADDMVDADWFAKMMTHATKDVDWVHADAAYCFRTVGGTFERSYRTFLRDGWGVLNFVRREVVGEVRFPVGMRFKEDVIFFTALALKKPRIAWVNERGYNYRRHSGSAIAQRIREADSIRFCEEILMLGLPREDAGRAIGFDLVLWVNGRDWSKGYDPETCPILAFWRREIAAGRLKASDLRWWWRVSFRHWLKTGDLGWFVKIRALRVWLEIAWRRLRGLPI